MELTALSVLALLMQLSLVGEPCTSLTGLAR